MIDVRNVATKLTLSPLQVHPCAILVSKTVLMESVVNVRAWPSSAFQNDRGWPNAAEAEVEITPDPDERCEVRASVLPSPLHLIVDRKRERLGANGELR